MKTNFMYRLNRLLAAVLAAAMLLSCAPIGALAADETDVPPAEETASAPESASGEEPGEILAAQSAPEGAYAICLNQIDISAANNVEFPYGVTLVPTIPDYTGTGTPAFVWLSADETNVSASVFGGVQMYWASEAATVNASKPQFREMKMDLEKMMGFAYCTDEMLTDAAFLSGFLSNAFTLAADRLLVDATLNGDGVGKPLGIFQSAAAVTVAKETSQAAGTFQGANAIKMQARSMPRNRDRLVWVMHPDVEEQLPYLSITSGDASKFLWNPEGGLGNFDTQRVLNKPVLFEDSCAALGSVGDVSLIDPFYYILLSKGAIKQDWSVHVEFLTDQNCFRIIFRCNGQPKVNVPLTIKNSAKTRSPFVLLGARG